MTDGSGNYFPLPAAAPAAGWYPDPAGSPRQRWWNGAAWTMDLHYPEPPVYGRLAPTRVLAPDTPAYTAAIWIITLLPLLSLINVASTDLTADFNRGLSEGSTGTTTSATDVLSQAPQHRLLRGIGHPRLLRPAPAARRRVHPPVPLGLDLPLLRCLRDRPLDRRSQPGGPRPDPDLGLDRHRRPHDAGHLRQVRGPRAALPHDDRLGHRGLSGSRRARNGSSAPRPRSAVRRGRTRPRRG
ncbi:DUF2510 domain-containing protein [Cryobacterium breve]|uniref:DUF2510 domain-containing protein n=1 Tax=Cryobacterium breve TaxID=1259258 RepID=A0ABY7NGV6_9MICO|nr:DUF2510 domain-containing protein [Cryobacterium breve]